MKTCGSLPLLILGFGCATLALAETPGFQTLNGPLVIFDHAALEIFPESWRTAKVNAKAELLEDTELQRCREIAGRALSKYPQDMLKATLTRCYFLGRLEYSGVVTGGTRSLSAVYVVCKPTYSSVDVERIFHAEYSSVLFQKFRDHFDATAWSQINPGDFRYLGGGVQAVKSGQASQRSDQAMREQGFIRQYAKASIEEDFNCHAAALLMGDGSYWAAVEQHPKLNAKSALVMDFYAKVHASFTRAHFQTLRAEWLRQKLKAP